MCAYEYKFMRSKPSHSSTNQTQMRAPCACTRVCIHSCIFFPEFWHAHSMARMYIHVLCTFACLRQQTHGRPCVCVCVCVCPVWALTDACTQEYTCAHTRLLARSHIRVNMHVCVCMPEGGTCKEKMSITGCGSSVGDGSWGSTSCGRRS